MMRKKLLYSFVVFLGFPFFVLADSVLPAMINLQMGLSIGVFAIILGLAPITIIEAAILWLELKNNKKIHFALTSFLVSLAVNLASTLIGFCLLPVYKKIGDLIYRESNSIRDVNFIFWLGLFLLINLFISIFVEMFVARGFFKTIDRQAVKKAVFHANLISYSLLFVFVLLYFWWKL